MKRILRLLVSEFLDREVNKLKFGDHIDIEGKDYLEVPIKGTGLDLFFKSIRFTCEIVHKDGYVDSGKRTDKKYFKLGFNYCLNEYSKRNTLRRYVAKGDGAFSCTVGKMIGKVKLPEFPKQFLEWNWNRDHKEYDYQPSDTENFCGSKHKRYRKWMGKGEDFMQQYWVKTFMGENRYEVLTKFLEFWNSYMEMLEFLCFHGWKAALLGEVLLKKYPGLVFIGRKAMNSYIFTMYNKFKNKEKDLNKWKKVRYNEYTGEFEDRSLDIEVLEKIYHLITEFFGYEIWDDLYHRHKLPTEEDIQIISELDETSFRGRYPRRTFKDFVLPSLDCEALPSGMKGLPYRMNELEFIQYAEEV